MYKENVPLLGRFGNVASAPTVKEKKIEELTGTKSRNTPQSVLKPAKTYLDGGKKDSTVFGLAALRSRSLLRRVKPEKRGGGGGGDGGLSFAWEFP